MNAGAKSVNVRYFAILREQSGMDGEQVSTHAETPAELYGQLAARYGFTLTADRIRAAAGDRFCAMDAALADGASIVFVPPVAGG